MENIVSSDALMYIGAGLCALSMTVSAWGLAKVWSVLIETIGRNPQVKKDVQSLGYVAAGTIEAIALYALVVAIMMIK
ncbi:MAG: F0F1 ATP synthase subunit C [Alphaproteobacteria bacterium]|nr:F0F1 ATP synthase subunit C [Alphaproteobacteria bacterium]